MAASKSKRKSKPKARKPGTRGKPVAGTEDWKPAFLDAIRAGAHVTEAARIAKVHVTMPYRQQAADDVFRRAWAEASHLGTRHLEAEAQRRAFHGTLKPVFQSGKLVGHVQEYSDTLLMFLLKGRRPKKYRDNSRVEVAGDGGGPVRYREMTDDELDSEITRLETETAQLAVGEPRAIAPPAGPAGEPEPGPDPVGNGAPAAPPDDVQP